MKSSSNTQQNPFNLFLFLEGGISQLSFTALTILAVMELNLYILGWPQTHSYPPASASQVLA